MILSLFQVVVPLPPTHTLFFTDWWNTQFLARDILSKIMIFAIVVAGFYFLARLIMIGFQFLTSTGDPSKLQAANQNLTSSALGLILAITAFFIYQIIQTVFGIV